jgi:hypothetical protein
MEQGVRLVRWVVRGGAGRPGQSEPTANGPAVPCTAGLRVFSPDRYGRYC